MKLKIDRKRILENTLLSFFSFLFTLIFLEIGARIYLFHFAGDKEFATYASLHQLDKSSERVGKEPLLSHNRYLGYNLTPNYNEPPNRHNSLGYRGEEIIQAKPEGEFRIVCIGGSTTYTTRVEDYHLSYPYLLEKELLQQGYTNVKVINAGVPGWDTWNMSIDFNLRGLDLNPDLIIYYEAVNDIKARLVWPPEAYKGDNSGRSQPMVSRVHLPSILEYSTLLRMLGILLDLTEPHTSSSTIDRTPDTYYGNNFHRQLKRGTYPSDFFTEVSVQQMLQSNPPIYYQRNIENLITIAQDRNINVMLATFAYLPLREIDYRVASEEYIYALNEHNDVLKKIARKKKVNLFDFASLFPKDQQYFGDGVHVNEMGSQLKASLFANYILENQLIPKPKPQ